MIIDPEFAEMMTETVTVAAKTSRDGYGRRSFGAVTSIQARLVFEVNKRVNLEGEEIVETGKALCYGAYPDVTVDDLLTLPDGSTPSIIAVDTTKDESGGDYYTVIRFGR